LNLSLRSYFSLSQFYFYGFVLVAIGLVCSRFLVSVGTFMAAGAWLISGNPLRKLKFSLSNRWTWILISLFLWHVLSLLWSSDWTYGWKDIRIKLPLFIFPILISAWPLDLGQLKKVFLIYISAIVVISLYYFLHFYFLNDSLQEDYRTFNRFDSHIRYGLQLVFGVVICVYFFLHNKESRPWVYLVVSAFFIFTLYIVKSFNAYIVFMIVLVFLLKRLAHYFQQLRLLYLSIILSSIAVSAFGIYIFYDEYKLIAEDGLTQLDLNDKTKLGAAYYHDVEDNMTENGYRTMSYICNEEIYATWQQKSKIAIRDSAGYHKEIYYVLLRYLTSKGLRKDAEGINALNQDDIKNIESGCANFMYCKNNKIRSRVHEFWYEIKEYELMGNPNGHSVPLRFEFWKTAWHIIKRYPMFGTGIGDYKNEFIKQYELDNSILSEENRLRSHNQYLSIFAALGFVGLLIFCFSLYYPIRFNVYEPWLLRMFLLIISFSFIGEDTLETQIGLTFFAFWNSLLIFSHKPITQ
jgi:hypothetical protein